MDQGDFARSGAVQDFVGWMRELPALDWDLEAACTGCGVHISADERHALGALPGLMIRLDLPHSRFVPGGLRVHAPLWALPLYYRWQAPGVVPGDFATTRLHLAGLAQHLRQGVLANDLPQTLEACSAILRWAGERNMNHGARPYLFQLGGRLPQYLLDCSTRLELNAATLNPDMSLRGIPAMNSMLSKVHSFMAVDGLPIYDSRVAGAMATVVETWRQCTGQHSQRLPRELAFQSIPPERARTVQARFSATETPGVLYYNQMRTPSYWAAAMVRLGWLLQMMLGKNATPAAMRAMEAALFMAGYDCAGIAQPLPHAVHLPNTAPHLRPSTAIHAAGRSA